MNLKSKLKLFIKSQIQLIKNFSYLALFEFINLFLPLIITPLILQKIGFANYGKISFLQAILLTICVITDWGYNITGVRDISINKNNKRALQCTISKIIYTKSLLFIALFLVYLSISLVTKDYLFYLLSFTIVLGKTIYPNWLYLGLEKNQFLIFGAIASNLLYAILIIFFIKTSGDYIFILFFQGGSMVLIYIIMLFYATKTLGISILFLKKSEFLNEIKINFPIFLSNSSLTLSSYSSTLILKFFISDFSLGIFSLAQKIGSISKLGLTIFSTAIFPKISQSILDDSKSKLKKIIFKIYLPYVLVYIISLFISLIFIKNIVYYFDSTVTMEHIFIVSVMFLIPSITMFNIIPYLVLLANKQDKEYSKTMVFSVIISVISLLLLVPFFEIYGAIFSIIIVEIYLVYSLYKKSESYLPKLF